MIELPPEIWCKIFYFYRENLRQIAAQKRKRLHKELIRFTNLARWEDYNGIGATFQHYYGLHYAWIHFAPRLGCYRSHKPILPDISNHALRWKITFKNKNNTSALDITCGDIYKLWKDMCAT